ncbi:MAG TPA: biotin/lipoyl-containing protein [Candidatus Limnocylindrales bacterium]|nr:biotin/lipoyl-containing protein [Candidatus Limnocylindrales bacterium]
MEPASQHEAYRRRTAAERAADHAALDRLAEGLVPALVAKLGATGLGELEVREEGWKVRLRRSPDAVPLARRSGERPSRAQPGHEGHGHPPAAVEGRSPSRNGHERGEPITAERPGSTPRDDRQVKATSPAVGIFRPGLAPGARVRAGDRVAVVDLLGVPQDVVSPIDGIVGATLVDAGDGVEYGEPLVLVEPEPG